MQISLTNGGSSIAILSFTDVFQAWAFGAALICWVWGKVRQGASGNRWVLHPPTVEISVPTHSSLTTSSYLSPIHKEFCTWDVYHLFLGCTAGTLDWRAGAGTEWSQDWRWGWCACSPVCLPVIGQRMGRDVLSGCGGFRRAQESL